MIGFVAIDEKEIIGSIFFSRVTVSNDQVVFMLSPVAITPNVQGMGIGQKLINFALGHLRLLNVNVVITYGDPAFYSKTNFEQISEEIIKAPFPLSQPVGWLAQGLDGRPLKTIHGSISCVEAFNDPKYW